MWHAADAKINVLTGFLASALALAMTGAYAANISPSHIQVLAASCAACHGPNGNSAANTPVLADLDSEYFILQMQAFRSGQRNATVMHQHAKGLSQDEIEQLAIYFSQQTRFMPPLLPAQTLNAQASDQQTGAQAQPVAQGLTQTRDASKRDGK